MPPIPGMMHWHHYLAKNIKALSKAVSKAARTLDASIGGQPQAKLEPLLVRNAPKQPTHPLARIRQQQSRWYSTARRSVDDAVRNFTSSASGRAGAKYDRASFPKSRISTTITQSSGRAPFASTLRPNLTGGALGRTAGGYALGGGRAGARYFSHGPACQAQIVQNVSHAVRAFVIGGQKAQYDGVSSRSGEKRFKAVSALQEETGRKMRDLPKATPGSYVDFRINPTVTALTPLAALSGFSGSKDLQADHVNTDGLLDVLSADFSRALKDLAVTLNDLKRLSVLGDLPLTYEGEHLRVHFPGCDAGTVERLCDELSILRGTVAQDEAFDAFAGTEIALLFPFAPSQEPSEDCESLWEQSAAMMPSKCYPIDVQSMFTPSETPAYSTQSAQSDYSDIEDVIAENPWLSSPSGYESVQSPGGSDYGSDEHSPLEYQGFEGIYRFIEELDSVRR